MIDFMNNQSRLGRFMQLALLVATLAAIVIIPSTGLLSTFADWGFYDSTTYQLGNEPVGLALADGAVRLTVPTALVWFFAWLAASFGVVAVDGLLTYRSPSELYGVMSHVHDQNAENQAAYLEQVRDSADNAAARNMTGDGLPMPTQPGDQ